MDELFYQVLKNLVVYVVERLPLAESAQIKPMSTIIHRSVPRKCVFVV